MEQLHGFDHDDGHNVYSEFMELVSRGKLKHPSAELYDLSLYIYTFFKNRKVKCFTEIFLQAFKFIYECTGYTFENIDKILRRYVNTIFNGDTIGAGGGCDLRVNTRIRSAWGNFRELLPILTSRALSYIARGQIYSTYIRSLVVCQ